MTVQGLLHLATMQGGGLPGPVLEWVGEQRLLPIFLAHGLASLCSHYCSTPDLLHGLCFESPAPGRRQHRVTAWESQQPPLKPSSAPHGIPVVSTYKSSISVPKLQKRKASGLQWPGDLQDLPRSIISDRHSQSLGSFPVLLGQVPSLWASGCTVRTV